MPVKTIERAKKIKLLWRNENFGTNIRLGVSSGDKYTWLIELSIKRIAIINAKIKIGR